MTARMLTLAEGRQQLARVLEQLEALRFQLIGIQFSLPEPLAERVRLEDVSEDADAETDLRTTVACALTDSIEPALQSFRRTLATTAEKRYEEQP